MSGYNEIFEILSHPIRRNIVFLLHGKPRTFSEIMKALDITSGKLSFHLRRMKGLILSISGKYTLSQRGRRVSGILLELKNVGLSSQIPKDVLTLGNVTVLCFRNHQIKDVGREFAIENVTLLRFEQDVEPEIIQQFILSIRNVQIIEAPKILYPQIKLQNPAEFVLS